MQHLGYDIRIYKTDILPRKTHKLHRVRWKVDGTVWRRSFRLAAQAESFRSELNVAARKGEAFSLATGEPVSWARSKAAPLS